MIRSKCWLPPHRVNYSAHIFITSLWWDNTLFQKISAAQLAHFSRHCLGVSFKSFQIFYIRFFCLQNLLRYLGTYLLLNITEFRVLCGDIPFNSAFFLVCYGIVIERLTLWKLMKARKLLPERAVWESSCWGQFLEITEIMNDASLMDSNGDWLSFWGYVFYFQAKYQKFHYKNLNKKKWHIVQ